MRLVDWVSIVWILALLSLLFLFTSKAKGTDHIADVREDKSLEFYLAAHKTISPTPVKRPIEQEIERVFGQYAPRAIKILTQGVKGTMCPSGENNSLNSKARYVNKDGSVDRGLFQISSKYHPGVSDACAYDYKCNINYAHRMFLRDNKSFKRWTCGKVLGI